MGERFDHWLHRQRELRGWTQQKVSDELRKLFDDSAATGRDIGRWERAVRIPGPFYREKLCALFGCRAGDIRWDRQAEDASANNSSASELDTSVFLSAQAVTQAGSTAVAFPIATQGQGEDDHPLSSAMQRKGKLEERGDVRSVSKFFGRQHEREVLEQWIVNDRCQIVGLWGLGGVGKTALAVKVMEQVKQHFDFVFWRSLQSAPPLKDILRDCILFLSSQRQLDLPEDEDGQLLLLIQYLRSYRCLIVLDNIETVLQEGQKVGHYREGYEGYGKLIRRIGEASHQSCLLMTSRERIQELIALEGNTSSIHSKYLLGLDVVEGKEILKDRGLMGSEEDWNALILHYAGNPLALKLVAEPIHDLFGGDVAIFLKEEGGTVIDSVNALLDQHFLRLSVLERDILYWLAIEREAVILSELHGVLVRPATNGDILSALTSLRQRSMIETNGKASFTLQPVIMEYVTEQFLEKIFKEIEVGEMAFFRSHAIMRASVKDDVRDNQIRVIVQPLASRLRATFGQEETAKKLTRLLSDLRESSSQFSDYGAGNILNLLIQLNVNLRGLDFSHLTIREAYLQGASLPEVNFAGADVARSIFTDNFGGIFSIALSPRDDLVAAGIANGEIRLWYMNGTPYHTYQGHTDWVKSVVFSPDGKVVASGSYDQTIKLWDVSTGRCLSTLQGHRGRVYCLAFSPDGKILASSSGDRTVRLWDVGTGHCLRVITGHKGAVFAVAFDPSGDYIISGCEDKLIRFWNIQNGQCSSVLQGHTAGVLCLSVSLDGRLIASGSEDQTIRVWESRTSVCTQALHGHTGRIWSIVFGREEDTLFSGGEDQYIRRWKVGEQHAVKALPGHNNWIWSIALSADERTLVSGSEDQTIKFWEVSTDQCLKTLQGYSNWIYAVACSPDGNSIISSGADQRVRLWEASTGECLRVLEGHKSWIYAVAFSPDGSMIASGSEDQSVRLWEASTGECLRVLEGHTGLVRSVAFSPDSTKLASGSEDQTIRLWELHTGQCMKTFHGHDSWIRSVIFSSDGSVLISGSEDKTVRMWEVESGQCIHVLRKHTGRIYSIALSVDGQIIASGSGDRTIKLWEVSTGDVLNTLTGHDKWVRSVAFSPDRVHLASASADRTIRLWNVATEKCVNTLRGHSSWIYSVTFTSDGRTIVSGSGDGSIMLWDVQTGKHLRTLRSDRPYELMNITGMKGVSPFQKATLRALGAFDEKTNSRI